MGVAFRSQDGVNAIGSRLEECWILAKALTWLAMAIDCFQRFRIRVRELIGSHADNRTIFLVEFLEARYKLPGGHPFEIGEPSSDEEFWTGIALQGMKVEVVKDIPYAVD